jgi:hypothetical protein
MSFGYIHSEGWSNFNLDDNSSHPMLPEPNEEKTVEYPVNSVSDYYHVGEIDLEIKPTESPLLVEDMIKQLEA